MTKTISPKLEQLAKVLTNVSMPGTCEASLAILNRMTPREQQEAGMRFPNEVKTLAVKYKRFANEASVAAAAAQDAIDLDL